jgi:hypothetical protein
MTALGRELTRRGHRITVVAPPDAQAKVRAAGLGFHPLATIEFPEGEWDRMTARTGELVGLKASWFMGHWLGRFTRGILRDLPAIASKHEFDGLVMDQIGLGAESVCAAFHFPLAVACCALTLHAESRIPPLIFSWRYGTSLALRLRNQLGLLLAYSTGWPVTLELLRFRLKHHPCRLPGTETLDLHHLYRAMAFLGEPVKDQPGTQVLKTPRCTKDWIEEELFEQRRDLFSEIDLVFFDITSIYFEGAGGQEIGQYGKSKDHRPDLKQMVVGLALDLHGWPLCCELWPGNTADVTTLLPVVNRLRQRFRVRRVSIVADRGMISASTIAALESEELDCDYILGARMRSVKEVSERVLADRARYQEITPERKTSKDPSPLKVKEVLIEGRRYIVCLNEEQRRKDAADRHAIVEHLREQLKRGDKDLIGNKGYRKYLQASKGEHFTLDEEKIREEARYDGNGTRPFAVTCSAVFWRCCSGARWSSA